MTTDEIMALADDYLKTGLERVVIASEVRLAREKIRSAIEALQAEATRYRWLRDDAPHGETARILTRLPGDEWCSVIDAAMEQK
jgi:hypothetical protein